MKCLALLLGLYFILLPPAQAKLPEHPLLEQARQANPKRFEFAVEKGAKIILTEDGKSFFVLWSPTLEPPERIIVTLHGHESWAFDEFSLWQPYAANRGFAVLALQWWFGKGEAPQDYYMPQEMYPILETVLKRQRLRPGSAILHGFSRGAANSYALAALDRKTENKFFSLILANAGGAAEDFPPNIEISEGRFGVDVFSGTKWVMFCGGRDENPGRDGCPAMKRTRDWVRKLGGRAQLLEDPSAGHGGFHRNPEHVNLALDAFEN